MRIIDKKQMTEEDIKLNYITPALHNSGWKDKITMETQVKFTDGKINIHGNITHREKPKKADYILYINANNPIAIVEAKDNNHSVSYGMQQAIEYAKMLDLPFAYSSNGDAFIEHDMILGTEHEISMEKFPSPDDLYLRFKRETNGCKGFSDEEERILNQPFYTSLNAHSPRYYQRIAVNKTLYAIARGQQRLLLVMATGTGKTYTAFQIVYRLLKSGMKHKILYLADRNILVDQSIQQDFAPLEKTIHKVNFSKDDPSTISSYEVYFSLYQQLAGNTDNDDEDSNEDTIEKFKTLFKPDFFDLIIVDECHRGSAKKDSNWRRILEYFESATQIGMTATPKESETVSNIDYFGEPIYKYSLNDGIKDGFLAPFKVIDIKTDIGDGWRPTKGQLDYYGHEIPDRIYNNTDYDYNIVIQDRIDQVAAEITGYLKSTDRMSKTIVFCATEEHAERMRVALVNANADMVAVNPDYVVRITGSDTYGKSKLDYFISVSAKYPVIATTSKLLSTGADCKMTKLIVLDQSLNSMTEFKQIIGRGTRLREKEGKTHFMIMDFRGVTRLFADPDWDGPIEIDTGYDPNKKSGGKKTTPPTPPVSPEPPVDPQYKPFVDASGCTVKIINKTVSVYDADGKLLKTESVIDYTKHSITEEYSTLNDFINKWTSEAKKETINQEFRERGIDIEALKAEQNMSEVDDFDFICHIAYNAKPLTRRERANNVKKRDFLSKYNGVAKEVLEALLEKYADSGVYDIEKADVLKIDPLNKFGKPSKIAQLFGGKDGYFMAIRELESEIYKEGA